MPILISINLKGVSLLFSNDTTCWMLSCDVKTVSTTMEHNINPRRVFLPMGVTLVAVRTHLSEHIDQPVELQTAALQEGICSFGRSSMTIQ